MKAIIPMAGAGLNLRPHTLNTPKPLIPVAGKPLVSYIIDQLLAADVNDFVFVIGYFGHKIKAYIDTNYPDIECTYIYQEDRMGLGHAVYLCKEVVQNEDVCILLGDTIVEANLKEMISADLSSIAVMQVDDPRLFGIVDRSDDNQVVKMEEKPQIPHSNLAIVGLYTIKETQSLWDSLEFFIDKHKDTSDEIDLTAALNRMVEKGIKFQTIEADQWFDCGQKEVLLKTNAQLLAKYDTKIDDQPHIKNNIIHHPVHFGKNCTISDSILGPNVTIGDNTTIDKSIIKNSIVGEYVSIQNIILEDSVLGSDSKLKGEKRSLNIGDNTELIFSKE